MSTRKEHGGHLIQRVNQYVSALGKCTVVNLLHAQYEARGGIILLFAQTLHQPRNPLDSEFLQEKKALTTAPAWASPPGPCASGAGRPQMLPGQLPSRCWPSLLSPAAAVVAGREAYSGY